MDSLLSIVQMPAGVPVGTLAIGRAGAVNAGVAGRRHPGVGATRQLAGARCDCAARRGRPAAVRDRAARPGMTFPLPPNATIGLVGGGQLGRMSALAAARLGYRCHILTRERGQPGRPGRPPASPSATTRTPVALRAFAAAVDVISFEFENVSAEGLDLLASLKPVRPAPAVLRISQDRVRKSASSTASASRPPRGARSRRCDELHAAVARAWVCRRC